MVAMALLWARDAPSRCAALFRWPAALLASVTLAPPIYFSMTLYEVTAGLHHMLKPERKVCGRGRVSSCLHAFLLAHSFF